jgi:hypothetical protein
LPLGIADDYVKVRALLVGSTVPAAYRETRIFSFQVCDCGRRFTRVRRFKPMIFFVDESGEEERIVFEVACAERQDRMAVGYGAIRNDHFARPQPIRQIVVLE